MDQQKTCAEVKKMLTELEALVPKIETLKESIDSGQSIEEIKKTKKALLRELGGHRELRFKLKEWERRSKKTQRIADIKKKVEKEEELSIGELYVLYEIGGDIKPAGGYFGPLSFGYQRSTEPSSIKSARGAARIQEDFARIYGCTPEQVTAEEEEGPKEGTVVCVGGIIFDSVEPPPKSLRHVAGQFEAWGDYKRVGAMLKNLDYVGSLSLQHLEEIPEEGFGLPKYINGDISMPWLRSAKRLDLPRHVNGSLKLPQLSSKEGLYLPEYVGGNLAIKSIASAKGLKLPEYVGGTLFLNGITSSEGLVLPKYVGDTVVLGIRDKEEQRILEEKYPSPEFSITFLK